MMAQLNYHAINLLYIYLAKFSLRDYTFNRTGLIK